MSKLDLGEILANNGPFKDVPNSGTEREQIEYIRIDQIDSDPNNFYELSGVDELAANIELCGLQQPIRVRTNPEDPERVIIVSGHRRRAAIEKLVQDGREDMREVPCIREKQVTSPALQELRLIYANSDTRRMTSSDISKQAERVEALLYQLKEEGYDFPGRMRDHVAEACKVSKSKLSRLKVIRDSLNSIWLPAYDAGDLGESTAYALARLSDVQQRKIYISREQRGLLPKNLYENQVETYAKRFAAVDKLTCASAGGPCENCAAKYEKAVMLESWAYFSCGTCCQNCSELLRCKNACPKLAEKVAQMKADERARRKQEKLAIAESERPTIEAIQRYWTRFGQARTAAKKSWDECCKTMTIGAWAHGGDEGVSAKEAGAEKITTTTSLPYAYNCYLGDVQRLVDMADLLGCSLDYLLCRTDNPKGTEAATSAAPAEGWVPLKFVNGMETPPRAGAYYCVFDCDGKALIKQVAWWDSILKAWYFKEHGAKIDAKCLNWFPLPTEEGKHG